MPQATPFPTAVSQAPAMSDLMDRQEQTPLPMELPELHHTLLAHRPPQHPMWSHQPPPPQLTELAHTEPLNFQDQELEPAELEPPMELPPPPTTRFQEQLEPLEELPSKAEPAQLTAHPQELDTQAALQVQAM